MDPSAPGLTAIWLYRLLQRPMDDPGARPLVAVQGVEQISHRPLGVQQRHAAAWHDALLQGRAGRGEGILHAVLLLPQLAIRRGADLDDGHAAGQLGEPLVELLAVVVLGGNLQLTLQLFDAATYPLRIPRAADDGSAVLGHDGLPRPPQLVEPRVLQLEAELLGYDLAAGEDGDVLQHPLAPVAEEWGPYRRHVATCRAPC